MIDACDKYPERNTHRGRVNAVRAQVDQDHRVVGLLPERRRCLRVCRNCAAGGTGRTTLPAAAPGCPGLA
jgi:hypothetical protein